HWNNTATEHPVASLLHEPFEAMARQYPAAIALEYDGQQYSYSDVNQRANQLAHYLVQQEGIGANHIVAVCLERGPELLVALLAVLKAGAAYLPLDPDYPTQRLHYILDDSQAGLLLTEQRLQGHLPCRAVVCVDEVSLRQELALQPVDDLLHERLTAEALAYVIYTSGSTGQPKGVMVAHQQICHFLAAMSQQPGMSRGERLLAVTSLSFDIHLLELFLPWSVGGTVVLAGLAASRDPLMLMTLLQQDIRVMQATPATWKMLLEAGWQQQSPLRVLCGGEPMSAQLATRLLSQPGVELWNMYGPTETTVWSCCGRISQPADGISVGRPIAHTRVQVLSAMGQLLPIGVAGELWIGGRGVSQGYLHKEDLTAERFKRLSDGQFWYRTGDLARWQPDGQLEILGRLDEQVKVHGFRIELGEIEHHLLQSTLVRDAAVKVVRGDDDENHLFGYVVLQPELESLSVIELHEQLLTELRSKLPAYMQPERLMVLAELPLTSNGKVDRKALPLPDVATMQAAYEAPQTATEQALAV
ncbi:amino acid adenylation domain-containing protein, partial [Alkalimonas amylolytica]